MQLSLPADPSTPGVARTAVGDQALSVPPRLLPDRSTPQATKLAPTLAKDRVIVINLSGRGDKDCQEVARLINK